MGDEVFYKRENENEWRGPAKVVGVSGKTVVVKHGDSLREIARVHITRIQGKSYGTIVEDRSFSGEFGESRDELVGTRLTRGEISDTQMEERMGVGSQRKEREKDLEKSDKQEEEGMVLGC